MSSNHCSHIKDLNDVKNIIYCCDECSLKFADDFKLSANSNCMALVREWTQQAQCGSNTDDERAVFEQCAHALHQLNAT
jgi:hypothetical protein